MIELSKLQEGIPYRQRLETYHGHMHDNFYLMKLVVVKMDGRRSTERDLYLFTTKEIITAVNRYSYDVKQLPGSHSCGQLVGYVYPVTYHNCNGVLTSRHLCKFSGHGVVGLTNRYYACALFSSREMRRAKERVNMYIKPSIWSQMWKGFKSAILRIVGSWLDW